MYGPPRDAERSPAACIPVMLRLVHWPFSRCRYTVSRHIGVGWVVSRLIMAWFSANRVEINMEKALLRSLIHTTPMRQDVVQQAVALIILLTDSEIIAGLEGKQWLMLVFWA